MSRRCDRTNVIQTIRQEVSGQDLLSLFLVYLLLQNCIVVPTTPPSTKPRHERMMLLGKTTNTEVKMMSIEITGKKNMFQELNFLNFLNLLTDEPGNTAKY